MQGHGLCVSSTERVQRIQSITCDYLDPAVIIQFNSIQDYLYSDFYDTVVAKQLYRKLSFYNRFIYCRNLNIFNICQNLVNSVYCLRVELPLRSSSIMLIIEELKIHHVFSGKYIAYSTKIDLLDYALIVFCLSGPTIKHLGQNPQPSPTQNIPLYSDIISSFITSPQTISSLLNITVPVRGPSH